MRYSGGWIRANVDYYERKGKLLEKYDVTGDAVASSGEYPLQDGFGWTSGVLQRLLALYPEAGGRTPGDVALSVPLVLTMAAVWTIFSG